MKLVIIYGPPGTGKQTVGEELAKLTGFKFHHIHLSTDLVLSVFKFGSDPYNKLVRKIRLETIKAAAQENVDLIITFIYSKKHFDFIKEVINIVESSFLRKNEVTLVKLYCDEKELFERIKGESRNKSKKVKTKDMLIHSLESQGFINPETREIDLRQNTIPFFKDHLEIDNTDLEPKDCAKQIQEHYNY